MKYLVWKVLLLCVTCLIFLLILCKSIKEMTGEKDGTATDERVGTPSLTGRVSEMAQKLWGRDPNGGDGGDEPRGGEGEGGDTSTNQVVSSTNQVDVSTGQGIAKGKTTQSSSQSSIKKPAKPPYWIGKKTGSVEDKKWTYYTIHNYTCKKYGTTMGKYYNEYELSVFLKKQPNWAQTTCKDCLDCGGRNIP